MWYPNGPGGVSGGALLRASSDHQIAAIHQTAQETPFTGQFKAVAWPFKMTLFCRQSAAILRAWHTPPRPFFLAG